MVTLTPLDDLLSELDETVILTLAPVVAHPTVEQTNEPKSAGDKILHGVQEGEEEKCNGPAFSRRIQSPKTPVFEKRNERKSARKF